MNKRSKVKNALASTTTIPYTRPSITEREVSYAADAARNGWGPDCYAYIQKFEAAFAAHLGVEHVIATSSGTGALHLGFAALGVGPGDDVILGDCNWIASVAPIVHLGARPVFVDILQDSLCLDPEKVEAAITDKTKAILAVHLYGNMAAMEALREIAARHDIALVEDAAEALGSSFNGVAAGAGGAFGAFSFHGTKTLTTGEGGAFTTNDSSLYEKALTLSNHGRAPGEERQFWASTVGYKFKMSNISAAIGLAQVERLDALIARKREIFSYYQKALAALPGAHMNPEPRGAQNGYWMPTLHFDEETGVTRELLLNALKAAEIDARPIFWPLSGLPPFLESASVKTPTPVSHTTAAHGVNLPSYHDMTITDQDRVIDTITALVG